MKRLYLFSVRFPYTEVVECFLADEFPFLAKQFEEVVVVPLKKEVQNSKILPSNCTIVEPIFSNKYLFFLRGIFCSRSFKLLWKDFFHNKTWTSKNRLRIWFIGYITINSFLNSNAIKDIEKDLQKSDVCYFYWGKWSNILSVFWKGKAKCVSRFHGWGDLWESDYDEYFPLRKQVIPSLNCAIHISTIGEEYFKNKYPECKTAIARLGSFDSGCCPTTKGSVINIVSCSSLWPLKRVDLIMKSAALLANKYNVNVCWTHIGGDGIDLQNLREKAENMTSEKFNYSLVGNLKHTDVLEYYKTHPCDLFVNLSIIEGVPVSIMEAISFGIPAIATNVGGTADIVVSRQTGELVSATPDEDEVADAMFKVVNNKQCYQPKNFWDKYYNAEKNYQEFAKFLYYI